MSEEKETRKCSMLVSGAGTPLNCWTSKPVTNNTCIKCLLAMVVASGDESLKAARAPKAASKEA